MGDGVGGGLILGMLTGLHIWGAYSREKGSLCTIMTKIYETNFSVSVK